MKIYMLAEAIKSVLVEMTCNDELPMDMNDLDIHTVMDKAKESLKNDIQFIKAQMIEKIHDIFLVGDNLEAINVLEILEACEDENELVDYVDGVTLIKKFEWLFTVKQLFEHIRPV